MNEQPEVKGSPIERAVSYIAQHPYKFVAGITIAGAIAGAITSLELFASEANNAIIRDSFSDRVHFWDIFNSWLQQKDLCVMTGISVSPCDSIAVPPQGHATYWFRVNHDWLTRKMAAYGVYFAGSSACTSGITALLVKRNKEMQVEL